MASGMDKGLMALMGIEDDIQKDEGLAPVSTAGNMSPLQSSQDMPSFFDDEESAFLSDQDVDIEMKNYSMSRSAKNTPSSQRTADFAGAAVSPQAHTDAVTSTPRASTSSLFASPVSSSQEGSLFPPNFTPPDEPPPRDIRVLLKPVTSSPPFFSSDSNPFGRPSPGKVRISRSSSSSSPSPSLFSPEFNPFARPPSDKIRVKKKSSSQGGDGSSMFSPTLSPRKTKKKHSPSSSSSSRSHVNTSAPSNATSILKTNRTSKSFLASPSPTSATEARAAEGLSSPISSFSLSRKAAAMFSDSDSDISPIEDNFSSSKSVPHDIVLNMSMSSDMDTGMLSLNKSPSFTDSRNSLLQDQGEHEKRGQSHTEWDEDEVMLVDTQTKQSVKAQKEMLKVHMEANKLMRGSSLPIKPRVSKTYNLSELMKQSQSKLDEKKNTARVPYLYTGSIQPSIPERQKHSLNSNPPKPKIKTVALSDDSEDEPDIRAEFSQSRLDAAKAFLIAPKQRRPGPAKLGIQPVSMSPQGESSIPMSPLSKNVSKMSISGGYGGSMSSHQPSNDLRQSFITSPSKPQRPGAGINLLKEEIRRKQAKSNMELRKKLAMEAKKSGKWMAPEEHAAEQMLLEEDADDEGDEDYDPTGAGGRNAHDNDGDMDEEEDGDYEENEELAIERGSADEAEAISGESESEDKKIGGDNADNVADSESNIEEESDGDDDDDEEDEEEEVEQEAEAIKVKARRPNSKKAIIEDEDELNVVIVNRENPPTKSEDDDEDQGSDENSDEAASDSGDDDDDADAHESQNIDGSPGFGNFFAPSMDQSVTKKQNVADDPTPTIESSVTSMPSSDPSPNQSEDFSQSQSLVIPSGILSAKFTPSVPDSSNPFSINASIDKEIADIGSPNVDDSQSLASGDLPQPRNAFDVLTGAQGLRRLRKKEASLKESIPKGAKSAFIEYEAEEEDDEHKGMGGIDYESDNDQDDYDLGDGMIDTTAALDSQDAEDVRKLHMKHEQEQHDKDISDLVHGIAAGNLWKRRNGQGDDLDIFDEEDMDGRFQRKKKLKVTEKFEKLADNPSTAAFARALKKEIDDDHIVFLSDPDESNDEADAGSKDKKADNSDNEDEEMAAAEPSDDEISVDKSLSNPGYLDEDEEEDEPLNTDKRKENLRLARLRNNSEISKSGSTVTAWTKTQTLPFGPSSSEHTFMKTGNITSTTLVETEDSAKDGDNDSIEDHIDEYNNLLKRSKLIRDIVDGVIDPAGPSVELIATSSSSSSSFSHRSTEMIDELDSTSFLRIREEVSISAVDPALRTFAKPRMLARQSSSFLEEERRGLFLSTVGEEGTGSVKDVNRRKMAFGAATAPSESTGSASSRQRN